MLLLLLACQGSPPAALPPAPAQAGASAPPVAAAPAAPPAKVPPEVVATTGPENVLEGVCEASALVWRQGRWVVADNEVADKLFLFDRQFKPVGTLPIDPPVKDIEALALHDGRLFVVGSHSRKKSGKEDLKRRQVVELGVGPVPLSWAGCPVCTAAMEEQEEGRGLNVEGAWWDGGLWLGLRAPVPSGKTLLVRSDTGEMREVDTGGLGVREAVRRSEELQLVLGPAADAPGPFKLWSDRRGVIGTLPEGLEGLAKDPEGLLWGVTDGAKGEEGGPCKEVSRWYKIGVL